MPRQASHNRALSCSCVESKGLEGMQWLCRISYPTWCCISMPAPKLLLLSGLTAAALPQQTGGLSLIAWQRQTMQSDPRQVPTPACARAKTLMLVVASRRRACWTKAHCESTSFSRTAWQTSGMPEHLWPEKYKNLSNATGCDYMSMSTHLSRSGRERGWVIILRSICGSP